MQSWFPQVLRKKFVVIPILLTTLPLVPVHTGEERQLWQWRQASSASNLPEEPASPVVEKKEGSAETL